MMNGGLIPGGSCRSEPFAVDPIWAIAASTLTPGWKNVLTTATPRSEFDSMCSMSLTLVVIERSNGATIRAAISSADSPAYVHTAVTTGMLMSGKMSVGVRRIGSGPTNRIRIARTMNVYGRFSAIRTIHTGVLGWARGWASG